MLTATLMLTPVKSILAGSPADKTPVATVAEPSGPFTFDFEEKLRFEDRENNFDFNGAKKSLTDGAWLEEHTRIGVMFKPASWFEIYAQGQDAREIGAQRPKIPGALGAEGDDPFDLRQLYVKVGEDKGLSVTLGRQVLSYGDERILGAFEWNNIARTWDAAKVSYKAEDWWVDGFAASLVNPINYKFDRSDVLNNGGTGHEQMLSGIYFSTTALDFQTTDIYALYQHQHFAPSDTDFGTFGTRWQSTPGKFGPWDYDAEFVGESGKVKGKDLAAFAAHTEVGYTLDAPWKPRFAVDYAYGSGDATPKDGKVNTFQNLYPTNHLYYGYMDTFSWQNMQDLSTSFKVVPCDKVTMRMDYHVFWLADTGDAWYRANGVTAVRPITPGASNFAGSELDLTVTYKPVKWLALQAGYSHFFAGSYLKDTGAHSDADCVYTQVTFKF